MANAELPGLHDWDFFLGSWDSVNVRLRERLVGSDDWETFAVRCECWPILAGQGNVDTMSGRIGDQDFEGASVRVLNAETGLWSIYWLDNVTGKLWPPMIGRFEGETGEFFGDDVYKGIPVRARFRWSKITPTSAFWEQAYSTDDGQTWETNWTTAHTRRSTEAEAPRVLPALDQAGVHDFDFLWGEWLVVNERLKERLVGCDEWETFTARGKGWPILGGAGNVDTLSVNLNGKDFEGASARVFNADTGQWSIYWADNVSGKLFPPVVGSFTDGVGEFYGTDIEGDQPVRVRFRWTGITPITAHWEQAFSIDDGATWETNWHMSFERVG